MQLRSIVRLALVAAGCACPAIAAAQSAGVVRAEVADVEGGPFLLCGVVRGGDARAVVAVRHGGRVWRTAPREDGRYALELPWPAPYLVTVEQPGGVPHRPAVADFPGNGWRYTLDLDVWHACPLGGTVTWPDAPPDVRPLVVATPAAERVATGLLPVEVRVDAAGRFALGGLSPLDDYLLAVLRDDVVPARVLGAWRWRASPSDDAAHAPARLPALVGDHVTLRGAPSAAPWLTVDLRSPDGSPYIGPAVVAWRPDDGPSDPWSRPRGESLEDGAPLAIAADAPRVAALRDGRAVLRPTLVVPGHALVDLPAFDVLGPHRAQAALARLARLRVVLGDDPDRPEGAVARVDLLDDPDDGWSRVRVWRTLESGAWLDLDDLPAGFLALRATLPDGRVELRAIELGEDDATVVLVPRFDVPPGRLRVLVRSWLTRPLPGLGVRVRRADERGLGGLSAVSGTDGTASFDALAPGTWLVSGTFDPEDVVTTRVDVASGVLAELVLTQGAPVH